MPRCVVASSGYEGLNFTLLIQRLDVVTGWEISTEIMAHLVTQMLHVELVELK